jgi:nitric oxide synthase oxygenase domain/subunit
MLTAETEFCLHDRRNPHLFMNANPFRFDDPQPILCKLIFKNSQRGSQQRQRVFDALPVWTQHPDAMVACWRINADIRETEIERDEDPFLCLRGIKHSWVRVPAQLLSKHGMDVVTRLLE